MGTVILVRHGRSTANKEHVLAGRTPGVGLDATGMEQAARLVERLADCSIGAIVSSPLDRCRSTVQPLAEALSLPVAIDERLNEVDYGEWTGRKLADLRGDKAWHTVQNHPSAMVFPHGEALAAVSARAVAAAREHAASGSGAVLLCSHGDVLGAILADALGMHQDLFQRLVIGPASISVVRYTPMRSFVLRIGDTGTLAGIGTEDAAGGSGEGAECSAEGADGDRPPSADTPALGGDPGTDRH